MKFTLFFFSLISLLDICFSANMKFIVEEGFLEFSASKSMGIHLPILLYMSPEQKHAVCKDLMTSTALTAENFIFPHDTNLEEEERDLEAEKNYPVHVKTIIFDDDEDISVPEMMIECETSYLQETSVKILVSYGFVPQTYYLSAKLYPHHDQVLVVAVAELSPTYVEFSQEMLEKFYLQHRIPIDNIRKKYPKVANSIENKGPLASLTIEEENDACASIFEIERYKKQSLTFKRRVELLNNQKFVPRSLAFKSAYFESEYIGMKTQNIICEGLLNKKDVVLLFLTSSFNGENSVFVQKREGENLVLDAYVRNMPDLRKTHIRSGQFYMFDDSKTILL